MIEVLRRDRNEKFAFAKLFASVMGAAQSVPAEAVEGMLNLYQMELYQDRYHPMMVAVMREVKKRKRSDKNKDQEILQRVDKMTVPDDQLPPARKRGGRRKR